MNSTSVDYLRLHVIACTTRSETVLLKVARVVRAKSVLLPYVSKWNMISESLVAACGQPSGSTVTVRCCWQQTCLGWR